MRTVLISDLHLGGRTGVDVLQAAAPRARLAEAIADADRLVLLGDTLELRHGPAAEALGRSRAVLEALHDGLSPEAEVVLVPGNHDHALLAPWLDARDKPLGLETRVRPASASPIARKLADWLGAKRTSVAYPGLWLRDGIYATHGHVQDVHGTIPTFERIAAGAMQRIAGSLPDGDCVIEDYERILAPLYAWIHSSAQRVGDATMAAGAGRAAKTYELLQGDGHKPVAARALAAAFPLGIRGLSLLVGPLSSDLSGPALRRNGLVAMSEALSRLRVEADHVLFGHTHRSGPWDDDDRAEWMAPGGTVLHNTGNWVFETHFMSGGGGESPYWPGTLTVVGADGPPERRRLLADLGTDDLRSPQ